jgi:hypothetical protein
MFTPSLFLIAPEWKQPIHPSTDEQKSKCMSYQEYYSTVRTTATHKNMDE